MKLSKHFFRLLGEKTSRRVLEYYGAQKILAPADRLLSLALAATGKSTGPHSYCLPLFIIGAPRSGSTLLYQYLSLVLKVSYISSLWSLFPRSGLYLFPGRQAPPADFSSYYGNSMALHGTHEGGSIFAQWFADKDHHFTDTLPDPVKRRMRQYFETVSTLGGLPWLIKNGRNALRISVLRDVFPEAVYIRLRRDPILVAQSIIEGRQRLTGRPEDNWTVMPKEWGSIQSLPYPRQVARQVFYIEAQMDNDLVNINPNNVLTCDYDSFCASPFEYAFAVCRRWQFLGLRPGIQQEIKSKTFKVSKGYRLSPEIIDQIRDEFRVLSVRQR